ncbi:MAG: 3'(2'),5'-bisphosphate nucleotidase CysQ [Mangrovicoccus sp.]|nr:3'(2'),5'-bisphosphate nucleotidase CysQ [Mangrovicoccus sp.]
MQAPDLSPTPGDSAAADLALLVEAARAAGDLAASYWRRDPEVWKKGDESPVSEADLAVDAMLTKHLRSARPEYGWLSEETPDDTDRLGRERVFIVDPIDGTRAFVAGEKTWAHALAVVEAGRVIAGVVFLPILEEMFTAQLGGGAALNDAPLSVSTQAELRGAALLTNKWGLDAKHWPRGVPDVARHQRSALAYRLALVGEGRFDASVSFGKVWEWDSAAGSLIVQEAGGTITDRHGAPLIFNQPEPRSAGVLAANAQVHRDMLHQSQSG